MALPGLQIPGIQPAAQNPLAPIAPAAPAPTSMFQQLVTGGIDMPKLSLIALTLFTPTGIAGLNLQVLGNTAGTMLKVASYGLGALWSARLLAVYPNPLTYLLTALLFIGPWYLWDCISILTDPDFEKTGFRPPLPIPGYPPAKATDGTWKLTPSLVSVISSLLPASALGMTTILNQYAPGLVGADTQKYIGYAAGGTAAAGIAFALFSGPKASAAAPVAPTAAALPAQLGGGLPPLSSFLKDMKQSASPAAFQESLAFLGVLAVIIGGGFALAGARAAAAN